MCSRSGHIYFLRAFHDIAFGKLELLISGFPRLLEAGQQHTFIEKDMLRYLFQPIEDNYVLLLTNRSSNVIEDLRAISQFTAITSSTLRAHDSLEFTKDVCFDLIIAFDEIYSELGITVTNQEMLKEYLVMESHEEAVQEAILQVHLYSM